MNSKNILIFLGGTVVGGVIGAVGAIKWLDKTYKETLDKRVAEMEEYYGRVDEYDRNNYFNDEEVNPVDEDTAENGRNNGPLSEGERRDIRERLQRNHEGTTNYASLYNSKGGNDIPPEDMEQMLAESQHPEDDDPELDDETAADEQPAKDAFDSHQREKGREPRIISFEKMGELEETYENQTLNFYMYDEVVTTENDDIIQDFERLIGDALTKYGFINNDESVIYVQNFEHNTVYEVQKVWSSFSETH